MYKVLCENPNKDEGKYQKRLEVYKKRLYKAWECGKTAYLCPLKRSILTALYVWGSSHFVNQ